MLDLTMIASETNRIVQNQAPILTGIDGSNIWSGQNVQQFNTLAIAWSMAKDTFSIRAKYQWVTIASDGKGVKLLNVLNPC
jgi:hypothetical protein